MLFAASCRVPAEELPILSKKLSRFHPYLPGRDWEVWINSEIAQTWLDRQNQANKIIVWFNEHYDRVWHKRQPNIDTIISVSQEEEHEIIITINPFFGRAKFFSFRIVSGKFLEFTMKWETWKDPTVPAIVKLLTRKGYIVTVMKEK